MGQVGSEYSQFADRFLGSTTQLSDSSVVFVVPINFPYEPSQRCGVSSFVRYQRF